ncbi:hypothetical protein FOMPIDRAFT_1158818, partial [Fomitopsis schrenkii]
MRLSAVYLYDRVLTSGQEIAVIWTRKMGLLAIIYTLMHVFTFLELLWYVLSYMNTPCRVSAIIAAVRIHAINQRDWRPAIVVMVLYLVPVLATIFTYSLLRWEVMDDQCYIFNIASDSELYGFELATRVSIIVADTLVLAVTWRVTYGFKKLNDMTEQLKLPLTSLLLRDGTAYFSILLVINVINIVMWTTNIYQNITEFPTTLTTVLLSRFFLNLRRRALAPRSVVSSPSQLSDLHLSTLIENLGGSLGQIT